LARSTPIWATNTAGNDGAQLVMQPDGNLSADPDPLE
jgi:hypothetical protein